MYWFFKEIWVFPSSKQACMAIQNILVVVPNNVCRDSTSIRYEFWLSKLFEYHFSFFPWTAAFGRWFFCGILFECIFGLAERTWGATGLSDRRLLSLESKPDLCGISIRYSWLGLVCRFFVRIYIVSFVGGSIYIGPICRRALARAEVWCELRDLSIKSSSVCGIAKNQNVTSQ